MQIHKRHRRRVEIVVDERREIARRYLFKSPRIAERSTVDAQTRRDIERRRPWIVISSRWSGGRSFGSVIFELYLEPGPRGVSFAVRNGLLIEIHGSWRRGLRGHSDIVTQNRQTHPYYEGRSNRRDQPPRPIDAANSFAH
jgi:hypothetical protein